MQKRLLTVLMKMVFLCPVHHYHFIWWSIHLVLDTHSISIINYMCLFICWSISLKSIHRNTMKINENQWKSTIINNNHWRNLQHEFLHINQTLNQLICSHKPRKKIREWACYSWILYRVHTYVHLNLNRFRRSETQGYSGRSMQNFSQSSSKVIQSWNLAHRRRRNRHPGDTLFSPGTTKNYISKK